MVLFCAIATGFMVSKTVTVMFTEALLFSFASVAVKWNSIVFKLLELKDVLLMLVTLTPQLSVEPAFTWEATNVATPEPFK